MTKAKTPEKSEELLQIERDLGFVFGTDGSEDTAKASPSLSVVCTNPTCPNLNQHIQLHSDSVQPIHCGACSRVLYCDHKDTLPLEHYEGTLAKPLRINRDVCIACQSETSRQVTEMTPIPFDQIPLHLLGSTNMDAIVKATAE